jgi:hypothetical protein
VCCPVQAAVNHLPPRSPDLLHLQQGGEGKLVLDCWVRPLPVLGHCQVTRVLPLLAAPPLPVPLPQEATFLLLQV